MFTGSLDDVLTDALVKNKVKFVELVLQQGVVMKEYLTVERLEKLYLEVNTLIRSNRTHYLQGFHKLWKSWKTWKTTKKVPCMEKSWNLKKLNNHGKIMEYSEII